MTMTNRHVDITLPEQEAKERLKRMTRRGFVVGGVATVAGVGVYEWLTQTGPDWRSAMAAARRA